MKLWEIGGWLLLFCSLLGTIYGFFKVVNMKWSAKAGSGSLLLVSIVLSVFVLVLLYLGK